MSVKIMGLVWDLDLPQNEKFVLLAYADHADHDGRNMYPAVKTIAKKTGYSERSIQGITRSLEEKGYLVADGKGPKGTNRWKYGGGENTAGVQNETKGVQSETKRGEIATATEPSLTTKETSKRGDLIDGYLELYNMPGAKKSARLDSIKSLIGARLRINPTGRKWEEFCRFADDRMQQDGQDVAVFLTWMTSQKGFEIQYWPPDKMRTMWPQAFSGNSKQDDVEELYPTL